MKFTRIANGRVVKMTHVPEDCFTLDFGNCALVPALFNAFEKINFRELMDSNKAVIIDIKDLKKTAKSIRDDWFGGKNSTRVVTGLFWSAFLAYIFPILLDICKVYVAFMVAQAFYSERSGGGGRDGRSGFQALAYYGKFYLIFQLIPWGVELIDQLGHHMYSELMSHGANIVTKP